MNFVEQQQESVQTVKGRHICTYGARYDDGFDKMRTTKFCHRYNWINRKERDKAYEIDAADARYHDYGNDAD